MKKDFFEIINKNSKSYNLFKKQKFRSLKHSNYFHIYDKLFSDYVDKKITIVEIGVGNGGSLFMWRELFGSNARIIGIDFNPSAKRWKEYGFEIFIGNQSDTLFWKNFFEQVENIDILIDDGGHTNEQQIVTLMSTIEFVNDNGIIIFEDVHSNYSKEFGNPSKYSFINFCYRLVDLQNKSILDDKINKNIIDKFFKIEFYHCLVVLHINRKKSGTSRVLDNGGTILNSEDYRLRDSKFFTTIDKKKGYLRNFLNNDICKYFKKFYPIIKYIYFKFKHKKNSKYFKKVK